MFENLSKKQKIIFISILSFMIIFIIYYIYITVYKNDSDFIYDSENIIEQNSSEEYLLEDDSNLANSLHNYIIVYVCGAVKESKIVTLKENSRIQDAIDAVGGLEKDADLTNINLAYILEDGEKIYIPKKGEEIINSSDYSQIITNNEKTNSFSFKTQKININKASQTELETIPGVGPSTASKIIDFRKENGKFNSIEDIKNVSGIGDAKYEKMKEYISVK